jgi:WD40 repeat protein
MSDEKPRATLSDKQARGGVIGGKGYGFQAAYIVSRIPLWLADPDFVQFLQEGAGDVDVRFNRAGGEERWYIQVKNYAVTPAKAREVFSEFRRIDRGSPGTYTRFVLACPGLNEDLKQLRLVIEEFRGAAPLYQPVQDQILDNTWADLEKLVQRLKLPVDATFLVDKVDFDTDLAGLTHDDSLRRLFAGSLLESKAWASVTWEAAVRAYEKVALFCYRAIRQTCFREQVERLIREAMRELPAQVLEALHFAVPFMRNPDFVGREEDLARLHQALMEERPVGIRPVGLTGMGGIGKTQLAVEYAYRYADTYPDGIFWINAAEPLAQGFAQLGRQLQPAIADRSLDEQIRAAASYLQGHRDALLILDNLTDPVDLNRRVTTDLVPTALPCRILFTTRRGELRRFRGVEIPVLSEDAALRMLLRHPSRQPILDPTHPERKEARTICAVLGYLPLALEIAGTHLGLRSDLPLASYLQELLARGVLPMLDDQQIRVRPEELPTRHDAAVTTTLAGQWESLESDEARLLLRVAGQLPEATLISTARLGLLAGLDDRGEGLFGSPLALALRELKDASLIEELRKDQVRLHPLVREFAVQRTPEEENLAFRQWCAANLTTAYEDIVSLENHCARRGVDAIQEDLITALDMLTPLSLEGRGAGGEGEDIETRLQSLLRLLQREAHTLRGWDREQHPAFFAQQVHNRVTDMGLTHLATGAAARLSQLGQPYLALHWRAGRESPALERTLAGHERSVWGVAVTPDGRCAISASQDCTLKVWDLQTGREVRTLAGHKHWVRAVAVTPDGRRVISASRDRTVKVWDFQTGREVRTLAGHADEVRAVAVTPDGRRAISASYDNTLKVWDLQTGREMRTLAGHKHWGHAVVVTPDGRRAISASRDCTLKVWDLQTKQEMRTLTGHTRTVRAVAVTPDGRRAISASSDNTLKVWDLQTGQEVRTLAGHAGEVRAVAVTPDGRCAISASSDDTLKVWNLQTGQEMRTLAGHAGPVYAVAVSLDGRYVISASGDRTLKVWDLQTGREVRTRVGHKRAVNAVAVTPDDSYAISASGDCTIKVWDLQTGQEMRTLVGHKRAVNTVAVTPDGSYAISASGDCTLKVWDLRTAQVERTLADHERAVRAVAVTPDGRHAISASADCTLKVWDLQTGQEMRTLVGHKRAVNAVVVTPDSRRAISASADCTLKVWDFQTGQVERTLVGHKRAVNAVSVTPDGRRAIFAFRDGTLKVWDLQTGQVERTLAGHAGFVYAVAVTPDGCRAFSASFDRTLKVWDLQTGQELATVVLEGALFCVALALDGVTILTGDRAGNVYCLCYVEGDKVTK